MVPDVSSGLARISRRTLLKVLGAGAASAGAACGTPAPPEAPRQGAARLLGLEGPERAWLDGLKDDDVQEIYEALSGRHAPTRRSAQLVARLVDHRSRLFAYVHYPAVADRRSVCDGLLRE